MKLGSWLLAMMQPLVGRILSALGFSVVSIVGVTAALDQLKSMLLTQLQLVPAAGLQLALLAGCGVAFGFILGAITFRMALWQLNNSMRILGVNT
ncbi:MAG: DUF2523 domain-containing protein [Rhodoferax sp.]|nr:MAG: DUF2523 domain-containing protein [Rhodoferax sp.]